MANEVPEPAVHGPLQDGEQCECGATFIEDTRMTDELYACVVDGRKEGLWQRMFNEMRQRIELSSPDSRRIYMVEFWQNDSEVAFPGLPDTVHHTLSAHIGRLK